MLAIPEQIKIIGLIETSQKSKRKTFLEGVCGERKEGKGRGEGEEREGVYFWRNVMSRVGKLKQRLASGVSKNIQIRGKKEGKKGGKTARWSTWLWKPRKRKGLQNRGEIFWRQESCFWISKKIDEKWGGKNNIDEKISPIHSAPLPISSPFSYRMSKNNMVMLLPKKNISVPSQNDASDLPKEFVHLPFSFIFKNPYPKAIHGSFFQPQKEWVRYGSSALHHCIS